jgi:hypothetical protein
MFYTTKTAYSSYNKDLSERISCCLVYPVSKIKIMHHRLISNHHIKELDRLV